MASMAGTEIAAVSDTFEAHASQSRELILHVALTSASKSLK